MASSYGRIGAQLPPVKIWLALAILLALLAVPGPGPSPRATWDVRAVVVRDTRMTVTTLRGPRDLRLTTTEAELGLIRRELSSFAARVRERTGGRLAVNIELAVVPGPLRRLSGPGPCWLGPADVEPALRDAGLLGVQADSLLVFAKVGSAAGPGAPVSHLGGAWGADRGLSGACFAGIAWRPGWLTGDGTVALHEWLHHLHWRLTEECGLPDEVPDPDLGRDPAGPPPGAPAGDGPFADWILSRRISERALRALAGEFPPADGYLREWTVGGRARAGSWRTVTLPRGREVAVARLPAGTTAVEVFADAPLLVAGSRVEGRGVVEVDAPLLSVRRAVRGTDVSFRIRTLDRP